MDQSFRCIAVAGLMFILATGCATAPGDDGNADPLEPVNRAVYQFNDTVDKAVLKPTAQAYKAVTPQIIDNGITNVFGNLRDVVSLANNILQLKAEASAIDASRVVYNTTFGLLGFFDVASYMDLPKQGEDFGQTLGYWGVGEGAYVVLPLLGPSTVRDTVGIVADAQIDPLNQLNPESHRYAARAVDIVDIRADLLRAERAFGGAALDPYVFQRDAYLQRRRSKVADGDGGDNGPDLDALFDEDDNPQ